MMNRRKLICGLCCFLVLTACAQSAKEPSSLLWIISGNGLESPSYLFGTHHLIPLTFLEEINGLDDAFEATEQTVGEMDMGDMNEMQMKIMAEAVMPREYQYETLLEAADLQLLEKNLKELAGVGLEQLDRMKPAMLSNLLSVLLYQKYYPSLSNEKSLDQYFQEEALKRSRPVVALESVEDQIFVLLGHQPIERQAEMLLCMLRHPELLKEQMDKLHQAYMSQDVVRLNALYEEELPDDPCPSTRQEKDVLGKNRNMKWLQSLPAIMQDKPSFIAVGCLHLVGEEGLIEGLRRQGYSVEAIR